MTARGQHALTRRWLSVRLWRLWHQASDLMWAQLEDECRDHSLGHTPMEGSDG